jgi:hypothetical protein
MSRSSKKRSLVRRMEQLNWEDYFRYHEQLHTVSAVDRLIKWRTQTVRALIFQRRLMRTWIAFADALEHCPRARKGRIG